MPERDGRRLLPTQMPVESSYETSIQPLLPCVGACGLRGGRAFDHSGRNPNASGDCKVVRPSRRPGHHGFASSPGLVNGLTREPSERRGVYLGMFEQSVLIETGMGKRTGAVAASFAIEAVAVGVLVLAPLIWGERLGLAHPLLLVSMPVLRRAEPEPVKTTPPAHAARSSVPRIFRLATPQRVPNTPIAISDDAVPYLAAISNGPAAISSSNPQSFSDLLKFTPPPPKPAAEAAKIIEAPHPVGGDVQAAKLIRKVIPVYPVLAKQARISGTVRLVGVIAKDGTIEQLQVVSGHPLLVKSAVDAVRQWIYKPTLLNGTAVEVIAPIDVIFTLAQ
jgi:periplasmic protein TonB